MIKKIVKYSDDEYEAFKQHYISAYQTAYLAAENGDNDETILKVDLDTFLQIHGTALYKAYLTQKNALSEGAVAFPSAQTKDAIFFQVVMKKIAESMGQDLGKHVKITRSKSGTQQHLSQLMDEQEHPDQLLSASISFFHYTQGESYFFMLSGGSSKTSSKLGDMLIRIKDALQDEPYSFDISQAENIVKEIHNAWRQIEILLPDSILELFILEDATDMENVLFLCNAWAQKPKTVSSIETIADIQSTTTRLQARILAPTLSTHKVKAMRFMPDYCKAEFDEFKTNLELIIHNAIVSQSSDVADFLSLPEVKKALDASHITQDEIQQLDIDSRLNLSNPAIQAKVNAGVLSFKRALSLTYQERRNLLNTHIMEAVDSNRLSFEEAMALNFDGRMSLSNPIVLSAIDAQKFTLTEAIRLTYNQRFNLCNPGVMRAVSTGELAFSEALNISYDQRFNLNNKEIMEAVEEKKISFRDALNLNYDGRRALHKMIVKEKKAEAKILRGKSQINSPSLFLAQNVHETPRQKEQSAKDKPSTKRSTPKK